MRNFSKLSDPNHNFAFRRSWHDEPQRAGGLQHLGREVAPKVLEGVARKMMARWLETAAQTHNGEAAKAFQEAENIRRTLGIEWTELLDQQGREHDHR